MLKKSHGTCRAHGGDFEVRAAGGRQGGRRCGLSSLQHAQGRGLGWHPKWVCLKMVSTPLYPMVLLIIIPFLNGYFIGNIPYFQTNPKYVSMYRMGTPFDSLQLRYKWLNSIWFMVDITKLLMEFLKPTYNWGAPS